MVAEQKVKGPVSYFPSIEKKYGQPIEHWIKLVQKQKDMKHMEVVNWLKSGEQPYLLIPCHQTLSCVVLSALILQII